MKAELWDTVEISFNSQRHYENPFQDTDVIGIFTHKQTSKSVEVNGFYDGDNSWRIRFMPSELGKWDYITHSTDPDLDKKSGTIVCEKPTKPYLHSPIKVDGHHFFYSDGKPIFLISTRMSCVYAGESVWDEIIGFMKEYKINRVLFMMGGVAGTVKDLYGDRLDFWRYNIEKFRSIDAFIDRLRQVEIIASPYFYYFNDGVQKDMTSEQDKAYIKYGMARFGAYANVMPVLSNEVEQKYTERNDEKYDLRSHEWANEMGEYLSKLAVFGLPVSVHNPMETIKATNPGFYSLLKDWQFPWANFMLRQAQIGSLSTAQTIGNDVPEQWKPIYNARGYARHNQILIDLRRFGIPVINEEPGYEMEGHEAIPGSTRISLASWNSQTSETLVPTFWTAFTAGAYAMWGHFSTYEMNNPIDGMRKSITPKYLRILYDIANELPYWEMKPANELVSPNEEVIDGVPYRTNFCLAKVGEIYLIFSLNGGQISVDLGKGSKYKLIQIDPRSGDKTDLGTIKNNDNIINIIGKEQVLLIENFENI